ncbi:MAG: sigma-54 dependent transcriptional regulator [Myxococcota bacterium]
MTKLDRRLLLADDDSAFRQVYGGMLSDVGFDVDQAADRHAVRKAVEQHDYPVILLDLMLPPDGQVEAGLEAISEIRSHRPDSCVIVVSGAGDTRNLLQAVRRGAYDFLTKPVDPDVLVVVVERALAKHSLQSQVAALQNHLAAHAPQTNLVGQSPSFLECVRLAERVASSDLPVLVTGENGTGKELLARFVHDRSPRREGPFVPINCGALPEQLAESILFGHVRGSFTGAHQDHDGLFSEANGGTFFLDEVGDLPLPLQVKVLRALESGEILPVGASSPSVVDVRIVSATNQDLDRMQAEGQFREDLFWRLNGVTVDLPPLRQRREDLPLLAQHFLNQCAGLGADGRPRRLSAEAQTALRQHHWPGNLRELRHEMQRATVLTQGLSIEPHDLSFFGRKTGQAPLDTLTLQEQVEALERDRISEALRRNDHNRTHTAKALGLSRQGLLKKMERYGLG